MYQIHTHNDFRSHPSSIPMNIDNIVKRFAKL